MQKKSTQAPWYKNNAVIVVGIVVVALAVYVFQSGVFTPATVSVNQISQAFVDQPTTTLSTTVFDSNTAIASSGWKLYGYKGLIPYTENGYMVVPGAIVATTGLWTNKLNIPVTNFDKQGLLVKITLASTSKETSSEPVAFKMVAGLSQDTTLDGTAFAGAETQAVVSSDLTTYTFLFTPNQFVDINAIKSITIGLNPEGADVASLIVKDVTIKTID